VGHSLGLLVVTVIFLSVGEQAMDLDRVGSAFEWLVCAQSSMPLGSRLPSDSLINPQTHPIHQVGVMMILLGLYTAWRAVHSEYYLKGDQTSSTGTTASATAGTPLLLVPAPTGPKGDVEAPAPQQHQHREKAEPPAATAATAEGSRAARWLRGLKERMLATVVGTVHGVAGAFSSPPPFW
jgi:hypothetical protein